MSKDRILGNTVFIAFTTRSFTTGIPTSLVGTPTLEAFGNNVVVPITAGIVLVTDVNGRVGFNVATITASSGNGYVAARDYHLVIATGTVDSVPVAGEVVGMFSLEHDASYILLGTPINGTIASDIDAVKTETASIKVDTGTDLPNQITNLNNLSQAEIVSSGPITTLAGNVVNVTNVNVTANNTDMRGTDGANTLAPDNASIGQILGDTTDIQATLGNPVVSVSTDIAAVKADTGALAIDWQDGGRLDLLLDRLITQIDTPVTEPGQMAPPLSAKMGLKIDFLYKFARNRATSTVTGINIYADNAATIDQKMTHNDDGSTYDRSEVQSGP